MRLLVSTRAVARIVSEPPSSTLRAAPKKRFGGYRAPASMPPDRIRAAGRRGEVVGPAEARDAVEHHDHVLAVLDHPLRPFDRHLGDLGVLVARLVEGRGDHLALDRALHVGDLFGALVDEQHDQASPRGCCARSRSRSSSSPWSCRPWAATRSIPRCPLPIGQTRSMMRAVMFDGIGRVFHPQPVVGEQCREVLESRAALGVVGRLAVDRHDLEHRRVLLVAAGRAAHGHDVVAAAQPVLPRQLDRHVRVALAGEVVVDPDEAVALVAEVEVALDADRLEVDRRPAMPSSSNCSRSSPCGPASCTAAVLATAPATLVAVLAVVAGLAALAVGELAAAVALRAVVAARSGVVVAIVIAGGVALVVTVTRLVTGTVARNIGGVDEIELPFRLRLVDGSVDCVAVAARAGSAAGGSVVDGRRGRGVVRVAGTAVAVVRDRSGGGVTGREAPVIWRIWSMISDFLLRVDALTPSASAIAMSWALSFDSRTDCSSACAVTLTFSLWWRTARPLCAAPGDRSRMLWGGHRQEVARSRRCMHMRTIDDRSADPCVRRCHPEIERIRDACSW